MSADETQRSGEPAGAKHSPFEHPERIGPYRLLQVLGEGGMGVVYEAEQTEPVRRRVALKVMKAGMDTKDVVARFEAERQALAVMEHPNIARVLDAGASAEGRPFFVMEHVRGVPINEYCDAHRLLTRERLELFLLICEAVQHAHQKGVIHRDLKPSNVLVTDQGGHRIPKIIDFGIAKATGQRLTDKTLVTSFGQAMGTLAYMSPEQAEMSGLDVDTRTDVYSIGVMLYELLVGRLPLDPEEIGQPAFIARLVMRETEPARPSVRLSSLGDAQPSILSFRSTDFDGLRRELTGDLDWIVMKAMEADRTRRYQTALALADDIRRHLSEEPVEARPPSATYRFRKFVRRNRTPVVAGIAAVVALLVALVVSTTSLFRATRAERQAATEAEAARQVSDFLIGLFRLADPGEAGGPGPEGAGVAYTTTARELLDRGVVQLSTGLADRPQLRARLMLTVGEVYRTLGLYEEAAPVLEQALAVRREAFGDDHPEVAQALMGLARLLSAQGEYTRADDLYERALEIRERSFGADDPSIAEVLLGLGNVYRVAGKFTEAESLLVRAVSIREAAALPDDTSLAYALSSLGNLYLRQSRHDASDSLLLRALEIRERVLGPNHPDVGVTVSNLGALRWSQQRLDEAEQFMRRSLQIRMTAFGPDHPVVADVLNNLGVVYWTQERYAEAAPLYDRARQIWEQALGPDHVNVAMALNNLAETYWVQQRYAEGEPLFRRALEIKQRVLEPSDPSVGVTLNAFANLQRDRGRYAEAEALYQRALAVREAGPKRALAETLRDYAALLRKLDRMREADDLEERAKTLAG
jgi:serine/threonine protein kinase/tetratricopeptide (TPR) repeat protein